MKSSVKCIGLLAAGYSPLLISTLAPFTSPVPGLQTLLDHDVAVQGPFRFHRTGLHRQVGLDQPDELAFLAGLDGLGRRQDGVGFLG
jgi:hypothetical protein